MKIMTGLLLLGLSLSVHADNAQATLSQGLSTTKLTSTIFALTGNGDGNVLFINSAEGVLVIDSQTKKNDATVIQLIKDQTKQPLVYLIDTHFHSDHTGGNENMDELGATIIAHHNVHARLQSTDRALPDITFNDRSTIHFNGTRVDLYHVPNAHTDGDVMVHLPDQNILHTGDVLFNGLYPFIDLESGGSVTGYIAGMEKALSLTNEDTVIIPGHGPLASQEDLETNLRMLRDANAAISILVGEGHSEKKVLELDPLLPWHEKYAWGFIDGEKMTRTLYQAAQ